MKSIGTCFRELDDRIRYFKSRKKAMFDRDCETGLCSLKGNSSTGCKTLRGL